MTTKVCIRCDKEKPLSEFNKSKDKTDGYRAECRDCNKEYQAQYKIDHKEELIIYFEDYEKTKRKPRKGREIKHRLPKPSIKSVLPKNLKPSIRLKIPQITIPKINKLYVIQVPIEPIVYIDVLSNEGTKNKRDSKQKTKRTTLTDEQRRKRNRRLKTKKNSKRKAQGEKTHIRGKTKKTGRLC
jgi:hypothetical protein